jgi:hypothetical protein
MNRNEKTPDEKERICKWQISIRIQCSQKETSRNDRENRSSPIYPMSFEWNRQNMRKE